MTIFLKISKLSLFVLIGTIFHSCTKESDIISEYVVRDEMKTEYRSVHLNSDFKNESNIELIESGHVKKYERQVNPLSSKN
jgi:hypothetical protein